MSNHDGLILDALKLAEELGKRGQDWADKNSAYQALDDVTKSVLAKCMLATEKGASVTVRDAMARCAPEFLEHLDAVKLAREAANKARVSYDVYGVYVEMVRTNASSQRALVNLR